MSDPHDSLDDSRFESQLEELMGGRARDDGDAQLRQAAELQGRIDDSLRRLFQPTAAPEALLNRLRAGAVEGQSHSTVSTSSRTADSRAWRHPLMLAATLAAVAVGAGIWLSRSPSGREPFFEPTPLAALYERSVKAGFEPYYECRDPVRFTAEFQRMTGVPLQLAAMPTGSRMLGLSYPGGLSRGTTAMLCEVDGSDVIVFVDRAGVDQPALAKPPENSGLSVFRDERDGLVFYEVTPLDEARVTKFLEATPTAG